MARRAPAASTTGGICTTRCMPGRSPAGRTRLAAVRRCRTRPRTPRTISQPSRSTVVVALKVDEDCRRCTMQVMLGRMGTAGRRDQVLGQLPLRTMRSNRRDRRRPSQQTRARPHRRRMVRRRTGASMDPGVVQLIAALLRVSWRMLRLEPMSRSSSHSRGWWMVAMVVLLLSGGVAWWVASRVQSPEQAAARASEPVASWVAVGVERRVLSSTVVVRGDVCGG